VHVANERTEGWHVEVVPQAGEGGCPIELDAQLQVMWLGSHGSRGERACIV
jgi:hypothetical protein